MKTHKEFIEDVKHASALPAQTCRALGPESEEDISMYANCEEIDKEKFDLIKVYIKESRKFGESKKQIILVLKNKGCSLDEIDFVFNKLRDANCEGGENAK